METELRSSINQKKETIPQIDWVMNQYYFEDDRKSGTSKFMGLSLTAHAVALLAVIYITIPLLQKPEVETITFEIAEVSTGSTKPVIPAPAALDESPAVQKEKTRPVIVKQEEVLRAQPALLPKTFVKSQKTAPPVAAKTATIDDIETEGLNESTVKSGAKSNIHPQVLDQDLENDFLAINQRHQKSIALAQKNMNEKLAEVDQENASQLAALEQENAKRREKLASANAERRQAEANAIAALQAKEAAAAEQAQREAERRQKQAAAASAAKNREGGSGGSGVRHLAELKQMPGNPRPQYESNERMQGQRGKVTFLAYITKEGNIGQLKTVELSGYSNLDRKSLEAVKKWKFYPGQEGWVEIPFSWDLKGDIQEMPSLLRRSFSQK